MSSACPVCGRPQGSADLPVCVHCGARLPASASTPEPPKVATDELARRIFATPLVFRPSYLAYTVELAAPFLIPAAGYALSLQAEGGQDPALAWVSRAALALGLLVFAAVLVLRYPGRLAVVLTATGARHAGRHHAWSDLDRIRLMHTGRGQIARLELVFGDGRRVEIRREVAATAQIASLANLADLLGELRGTG